MNKAANAAEVRDAMGELLDLQRMEERLRQHSIDHSPRVVSDPGSKPDAAKADPSKAPTPKPAVTGLSPAVAKFAADMNLPK